MREVAQHAGVGVRAAETCLENMARTGEVLCIRDRRKVPHRSRPVAEYLPPAPAEERPADTARPDFASLATAWRASGS